MVYQFLKLLLIYLFCFIGHKCCFILSDTFTCPILGPLVPLVLISGCVSSEFQNQSGFCIIQIMGANVKKLIQCNKLTYGRSHFGFETQEIQNGGTSGYRIGPVNVSTKNHICVQTQQICINKSFRNWYDMFSPSKRESLQYIQNVRIMGIYERLLHTSMLGSQYISEYTGWIRLIRKRLIRSCDLIRSFWQSCLPHYCHFMLYIYC